MFAMNIKSFSECDYLSLRYTKVLVVNKENSEILFMDHFWCWSVEFWNCDIAEVTHSLLKFSKDHCNRLSTAHRNYASANGFEVQCMCCREPALQRGSKRVDCALLTALLNHSAAAARTNQIHRLLHYVIFTADDDDHTTVPHARSDLKICWRSARRSRSSRL